MDGVGCVMFGSACCGRGADARTGVEAAACRGAAGERRDSGVCLHVRQMGRDAKAGC